MKIKINIPLLLTAARIAIVPFLVLAIIQQQFAYAVQLLIVAGLTDLFDGASARFFKQETRLGAYLDPVADKLLVVACYAALMLTPSPYYQIPAWFIAVVVVRELAILLGAWYWGLQKKQVQIAPTFLGKLTTALQLIFICFLLCSSLFAVAIPLLFWFLLGLVTLCVVGSFVQYSFLTFRSVRP